MIAQLTGSVRSIHSDRIILEVAGVGYLIHVTPTAAATRNLPISSLHALGRTFILIISLYSQIAGTLELL